MVAFEEKVVSFQKENDQVKDVLVRGSDEHLDFLLGIKKRLESVTERFAKFMDEIISDTNTLSDEHLVKVGIPSLLDLYSSSISLVATLKRSTVSSDLKNCCIAYYSQVENLRELISDLELHRANDDGLNAILEEINSF